MDQLRLEPSSADSPLIPSPAVVTERSGIAAEDHFHNKERSSCCVGPSCFGNCSLGAPPLYGNTLKRSLFGLVGEQQPTRRRKPTVKLSLESVEERIVPSASDMTQQMAPMIAAVQQEVSNAIQIVEQDIAQVEAMFVQEVDHLLGIPTTPNPASGSGAGSGSGSGATTTHSAPSQQLNSATQQAGNGSGSGAAGTAKDNNPTTVVSKIQPMTMGSGSCGSGSICVYTWDPHKYGSGTGHGSGSQSLNYNWSNFHNWLINGAPQKGVTGTIPDDPMDEAVFDGSTSNSQCIVNTSTAEGSVVLKNGFTAPFEIQGTGAALNIPTYSDALNPGGTFDVQFLTADDPCRFTDPGLIGPNYITFHDNVDIGQGGVVKVQAYDWLVFGIGENLQQSSSSAIYVTTNGGLVFGDGKNSGKYSTFELSNATANITNGGTIQFYQTGDTLISASANPGPVITNNSLMKLTGVAGAGASSTGIIVPVHNHGEIDVTGGNFDFGLDDANNNSLTMDTGSINLSGGAVITTLQNYTQTGGAFNIQDASETFGALTTAYFNGGTLNFTKPSGPGTLNTYEVQFNGIALNMRIWANTDNCDLIKSIDSPTDTIKGSSTMNVTLIGTQTVYNSWTLISSGEITGDFQTVNLPNGIYEEYSSGGSFWDCYSTD